MKKFWESLPEWQRERELFFELVVAERALDEVRESGGDEYWIERAGDEYADAFVMWDEARVAFLTSPAGRARARYFKYPLATAAEEIAA